MASVDEEKLIIKEKKSHKVTRANGGWTWGALTQDLDRFLGERETTDKFKRRKGGSGLVSDMTAF